MKKTEPKLTKIMGYDLATGRPILREGLDGWHPIVDGDWTQEGYMSFGMTSRWAVTHNVNNCYTPTLPVFLEKMGELKKLGTRVVCNFLKIDDSIIPSQNIKIDRKTATSNNLTIESIETMVQSKHEVCYRVYLVTPQQYVERRQREEKFNKYLERN